MNAEAIRNSIAKAIAKVPTNITLYRFTKTPDGAGGFTTSETPDVVDTFDALLDNSSHGVITPTIGDSGTTVIGKTMKLYIIYTDTFVPKKGDFFTVGSVKYTINKAVNILNLNICYECDLEDEEVEG